MSYSPSQSQEDIEVSQEQLDYLMSGIWITEGLGTAHVSPAALVLPSSAQSPEKEYPQSSQYPAHDHPTQTIQGQHRMTTTEGLCVMHVSPASLVRPNSQSEETENLLLSRYLAHEIPTQSTPDDHSQTQGQGSSALTSFVQAANDEYSQARSYPQGFQPSRYLNSLHYVPPQSNYRVYNYSLHSAPSIAPQINSYLVNTHGLSSERPQESHAQSMHDADMPAQTQDHSLHRSTYSIAHPTVDPHTSHQNHTPTPPSSSFLQTHPPSSEGDAQVGVQPHPSPSRLPKSPSDESFSSEVSEVRHSQHQAPIKITPQSITKYRRNKSTDTLVNIREWCPEYTGLSPIIDPTIPFEVLKKLIEPNYIYDRLPHWRVITSMEMRNMGPTEDKHGRLSVWMVEIDVAVREDSAAYPNTYHFLACHDPIIPTCQWTFMNLYTCLCHQESPEHDHDSKRGQDYSKKKPLQDLLPKSIRKYRHDRTTHTLLNILEWCPEYSGSTPAIDPEIPHRILQKLVEPDYIYDEMKNWSHLKSVHVRNSRKARNEKDRSTIWQVDIEVMVETRVQPVLYKFFVCDDPLVPTCEWTFNSKRVCLEHQARPTHGHHSNRDRLRHRFKRDIK